MSLEPFDANMDGWWDVLVTDRSGKVGVLLNPGPGTAQQQPWAWQQIAGLGSASQVRFGDTGDVNGDGVPDVAVAVKNGIRVWIRQPGAWVWATNFYGQPGEFVGTQVKDAKIIDVTGDGIPELILNTIHMANGSTSGVAMIPYVPGMDVVSPNPTAIVISPLGQVKYDECKALWLQVPQEGAMYVHGKQIVLDPSGPPDLVCSGELSPRHGLWGFLNPLAGQ